MKITALFSDQKEATEAVDALNAAEVETDDMQVIESLDQKTRVNQPAKMPATQASNPQPMPAYLSPIDIEDRLGLPKSEAEFFVRGVENGGVLVMVEASSEHAKQAKSILQEHGGRTTAK